MRPSKSWLITDTHFNHLMLQERGHRPVGFTDTIIKNWQEQVLPQDIVYHLGDVIIGKNGTLGEIMGCLPGTKYLVRGNHDHESNGWYLRHGFSFVAQGILVGGVWLTHAPQSVLPDGAVLNVHGHLHTMEHRGAALMPHRWKLLALEFTDYKLVEFNEFVGFTPTQRLILSGEEENVDNTINA